MERAFHCRRFRLSGRPTGSPAVDARAAGFDRRCIKSNRTTFEAKPVPAGKRLFLPWF